MNEEMGGREGRGEQKIDWEEDIGREEEMRILGREGKEMRMRIDQKKRRKGMKRRV